MSSLTSAAAPARAARPPMRLSHLGDELLARQAARGSERAFAALYERHHQQLDRYCRSILRDDADAQDALQSTFASALQALKRDRRTAPLRPWLYRIAHNEAISLLRRRRRDTTDELDADSLRAGASVEQQAADRARWVRLIADLGRLPERQRGALLLRELCGLSHDEIAIALGTSTGGAKQAIFEARQALTVLEEGRSMSCEEARRRISEGDRRVLRGRRVSAHLRACTACEAFALAIPARQAQLRALTPALAPAIATAVLARSTGACTTQGGAATAGAGAAGKAAGAAMAWKAAAGVAVIVAAAAGVSGIRHSHASSHAPALSHLGAAAAARHTYGSGAARPLLPSRRREGARPAAAVPAAARERPERRAGRGPGLSIGHGGGAVASRGGAVAGRGEAVATARAGAPTARAGKGPAGVGHRAGGAVENVVSTASSVVKTAGSLVKSATSAATGAVSSVTSTATSAASGATNQLANTVTTAVPASAPAVNTVTNVVKTLLPPPGTGKGLP